jgi:diguanylate cyclase (GGDEF)-like protein
MKKILIIDDNKQLIEQLKKDLSIYHVFDDVEILEATTYKEATTLISQNHYDIEIAVVAKSLSDTSDGKGVMLVGSNDIQSVILFDSYNDDDKLDKKLLTINGVLTYFNKNDVKYIDALVDFIHKAIRNSAYTALVVDDSAVFREKFKTDLENMNLNVVVANDGREALDIFKSKKYDISLVITDYNMPNMDGIELVRNLRKDYKNDVLSIIAISTDEENKTLTKFIEVGANDYIKKPYSTNELSVRIDSNLKTLEMFEKISNLANRDSMTGAYNRRYFFETATSIVSKNYRKKSPIAVATIDIDKFKKINDTYGHDVGDIAIKEVINVLNDNTRDSDLIARFGGEEFCILLEDITIENVKLFFEKIRSLFESNIIKINSELSIKYTVSIGVSYKVSNDISEMIKASDQALYEAKESGRNKVVIYE